MNDTVSYLLGQFVFREISNGMWCLMNLALLLVITRYLWCRSRGRGLFYYIRTRNFPADQYGGPMAMEVALAMWVYFAGSTMRSGWVWFFLWRVNAGYVPERMTETSIALVLGVLLGILGSLCCMRVFSRVKWGRRVWITAGILAAVIPAVIHVGTRLIVN